MGTWYTVIAGLLNILVIYDAYGGPLSVPISGRKKEDEEDDPSDSSTEGSEVNGTTKNTAEDETEAGPPTPN
jgi:hypothetical protein